MSSWGQEVTDGNSEKGTLGVAPELGVRKSLGFEAMSRAWEEDLGAQGAEVPGLWDVKRGAVHRDS